jgi:DNA gyrase subunit A
LNNLYKQTQLQTGFGVIMLSIVNGQPREMGLIGYIRHFIEHRAEVVRRRTDYELRKSRDREHLLLGFQKALENIDEVIRLIRAARAPREARDTLIAQFQFSEKQAQAIIELQLQRLTGMEQQKILDELADIQRRIAEYLEILGSEKVLREVVVKELREIQKDFGDERRTEIIEDTGEILLEDLVAEEDVAVTVTHEGYLKRTSVDTYRRQARGGKGRIGMGTRTEDFLEHLIVASTHAYMLIFTNKGRVYWLKIYEIPDAATVGKGKHISNLINLQPNESVKAFMAVREFEAGKFIVMVTRHGVIKKTELTEFDNPMSRGIIALGLDEGDELIAARMTGGDNYIFLGSHNGQAIRFKESHVRGMGRPARGVRAINLADGDYLIGMEVVEEEGLILSISERGYGKRTPLKDYRITARGGKGVINMKTSARNGKMVAILSVKEDSHIMIITKEGKIIRLESAEIRQAGRSTQGVRLVRMDEDDQVAAASVIPETNGENGEPKPDGQSELPLQ